MRPSSRLTPTEASPALVRGDSAPRGIPVGTQELSYPRGRPVRMRPAPIARKNVEYRRQYQGMTHQRVRAEVYCRLEMRYRRQRRIQRPVITKSLLAELPVLLLLLCSQQLHLLLDDICCTLRLAYLRTRLIV